MSEKSSRKAVYLLIHFAYIIFLAMPRSANSQTSQLFIHSGDSLYIHSSDPVSIFSDVFNNGNIFTYQNTDVTFFGKKWTNASGSKIADESTGGTDGVGGLFKFSGDLLNAQTIINQSAKGDNSFPNLTIDNLQDVTLISGNLTVINALSLNTGHLVLDKVNVIVGKAGKGLIKGYGDKSFVVTGTQVNGGYLVRNVSGNQGALVFPVGAAAGDYTPVSVTYKGMGQNIKLRVAQNLYDKATFGIPGNQNFVDKTWQFATDFADPAAALDISLQHNTTDEGSQFTTDRSKSYISRFDAENNLWDVTTGTAPVTPGYIKEGTPLANAFVNTRTNLKKLGVSEYFSKSILKASAAANTPLSIPDAISPNGDGLNDTYIIEKRKATDKISLAVYSRNQALVFQDNNYQNTFDGTGNQAGFLGNKLPDGVYYYIINVNEAKGVAGYLTISR